MVTGTASCKKILVYPHLSYPIWTIQEGTPSLWTLANSGILQKRLLQALEGLAGVACRADDILIYGVGDTLDEATREHGKTLTSPLKRCKEKSTRLN